MTKLGCEPRTMSGPRKVDPSRTSALGQLRYAIEFFAASGAVDDCLGRDRAYVFIAPISALFLMGRSIELGLKAFLLQEVKTVEFTHDLNSLVKAAEAAGLKIKSEDREIIALVNTHYEPKQLEYFEAGARTYPTYGDLEETVSRLLLNIVSVIPDGGYLLASTAGEMLKAAHSSK